MKTVIALLVLLVSLNCGFAVATESSKPGEQQVCPKGYKIGPQQDSGGCECINDEGEIYTQPATGDTKDESNTSVIKSQ
ncbi:MAG: hypothetical protein HN353_05900 [Bdellovibrionales bacterium]|jgi:hypothetical protein|nr:hypothetical protein [Bdellovibrionales bacterium]MBT3527076.1 hypothetical protein [Bdellovibrionales bacterium]MBT7670536.1 hypothetical protein [Bdellovibrionales bacterium]